MERFKVLSFLSAILFLAACSEGSKPPALPPNDHFFVTDIKDAEDENWTRPTDCRAHIASVLCEVNPMDSEMESALKRTCLGGEAKFQKVLEDVYDNLDPANQKMFCSVRRIFIERDFPATAYASPLMKSQADGTVIPLPGAIVGIRKSLLELNPNLIEWISWKEQLNFANLAGEFKPKLPYPLYKTNQPVSLLSYVMAHEFGHLFDFSNDLNKITLLDPTCGGQDPSTAEEYEKYCKPVINPGSWAEISWKTVSKVKTEKDFPYRDQLCFYWCQQHIDPATQMVPLYDGMAKSDFVSSYGATNMNDDFAEAWAMRWLLFYKNAEISISASPSLEVKIRDIYNSEVFTSKRDYINSFENGSVKYP